MSKTNRGGFFLYLALILSLLLLGACSGSDNKNDKTTTDGDDPVVTDGDSSDQVQPDGDPDPDLDPETLPECGPICTAYCDQMKSCDSSVPYDEVLTCKESCEEQTFEMREIACGLETECTKYALCVSHRGNASFQCKKGTVVPDGDKDSKEFEVDLPDYPELDQPAEEDIVEHAEGFCQSEVYCGGQTHCDPQTHTCLPSCDPYNPVCDGGKVCKVIEGGGVAPWAVCVDQEPSYANEGAACNSGTPCKRDLICGNSGRCEKPCNPSKPNTCAAGLRCKLNTTYSVGTCAFCSSSYPCESGLKCIDGYCQEGTVCTGPSGCPDKEACINGICQSGCETLGCKEGSITGTCDTTTGYCYANICEDNCASEGKCCNRNECGPCCPSACPLGKTCDYDPSCGNDLFCCVERPDCREKSKGYCGDLPCDFMTGTCRGACPATCPWGTECGSWTGFECKPLAPKGCQDHETCTDIKPCMACTNIMMGGICVAKTTCPPACLNEGFACTQSPGGVFKSCCSGGLTTCCPPQYCEVGVGCVRPDETDGDTEVQPDTCPECDVMIGTYCKDPSATCAGPWDKLIAQRDSVYPCWFIVYHDSATWGNRVHEMESCNSQAVHFYEDNTCILFWDSVENNFVYKCDGSTTCEARLKKDFCSK